MEHFHKKEAARPGAALNSTEADNFQKEIIQQPSDFSKSNSGFSGKDHNAFKVNLKPGIFLSNSVKRKLKKSCGCTWDSTYTTYVGPIKKAELARQIIADRGNVISFFRENLPQNDREKRICGLLNRVDICQENIIKEENHFLQEITREGYSESDFWEPPSTEGKTPKKIEREKELYERYQNIRHRNQEIQNNRRSIAELEEEKNEIPGEGFLIETGNTHLVADKGIEILSNPEFGVFQQQGRIVRIIEFQIATKKKNDNLKRANGAIAVDSCDEIFLVDLLTRNHLWKRLDARSGEYKAIDFPGKAAAMILSRKGKGLPFLTGFICCPTLREDGSLLESPGYDEESGLFFDPCGTTFPKIPENPTLDQAQKALKILLDLIKDFPFSDAVSRSVALAELMTGAFGDA